MAKLGIFASLITIVAALGFATMSAADDAPPCKRTDFKTKLVSEACKKGGQKEAKAQMQDFVKKNKLPTSCNKLCHTSLAPDYKLKDDALEQFKKAGGELLDKDASGAKKP
jgi:hypothetical protein